MLYQVRLSASFLKRVRAVLTLAGAAFSPIVAANRDQQLISGLRDAELEELGLRRLPEGSIAAFRKG